MRKTKERCETGKVKDLWKVKANFMVILVADSDPTIEKNEYAEKYHHQRVRPQDTNGYPNVQQNLLDKFHDLIQRFVGTLAEFEENYGLVHPHGSHSSSENDPNNVGLSKEERVHADNCRGNMIISKA
jgi:hypothetical protein